MQKFGHKRWPNATVPSHEIELKRSRVIKKKWYRSVLLGQFHSYLLFLNQYVKSKLKLEANPLIRIICIFSDNLVPIFSCISWSFRKMWQPKRLRNPLYPHPLYCFSGVLKIFCFKISLLSKFQWLCILEADLFFQCLNIQ